MSHDLGVWKASGRIDAKRAQAVYDALCAGDTKGLPIAASKEVGAFYRALVKRYPELADNNDDVSPWAAKLDRSQAHVVMPMSFSWRSEVVPFVLALASAHGLHVYDPQRRLLHAPSAKAAAALAKTTPKKIAPAPADPWTLLAARLTQKLAAKGFLPPSSDPGRRHVLLLQRRIGAIVQEVRLQEYARKEVQLYIRIEHATLGPAIATAVRATTPVPLIDTPPDELWRDPDGGLRIAKSKRPGDTFPAARPEDVARTAGAVERNVAVFLEPLFKRLSTLEKLSALFNGDPESILARYTNHNTLPGVGNAPIWAFVGVALARTQGRRDGNVAYWRQQVSEWGDSRARARWAAMLDAVAKAIKPSMAT